MSEMALTADDLVVIGRGRLIVASTVAEFVQHSSHNFVRVRTPQVARLGAVLVAYGGLITTEADDALAVTGWHRPRSATWRPPTISPCTSCPRSWRRWSAVASFDSGKV